MHRPLALKSSLIAIVASLFTSGSLFAQSANSSDAAVRTGGLIGLVIGIVVIIGMWKVFVKAGQPGWASIIPIYNTYIICKIVGKPGWWVLLLFIPFVNLIIGIILMVGLADSFGKGIGFAIGLMLLGFIFFPILGFSDATYQGPSA